MDLADPHTASRDGVSLPPSDPDDDDPRLNAALREYADADTTNARKQQLRGALIIAYRPLAERIAAGYRGRGIPTEDLEQVATLGVIHAIDRYDPSRPSGFLAFALPCTRGAVQRHFRDTGWAVRVPRALKDLHRALSGATVELTQQLGRAPRPSELARHLNLPLDNVLAGLQAGDAYTSASLDAPTDRGDPDSPLVGDLLSAHDRELTLIEYYEALRPALATLSPRDRTILTLRFFDGQTQTQIGQRVGLSQMHVSRVLARILTTLRTALAAD